VNTADITRERLRSWSKELDAENATPIALVGIGHGAQSGKVVFCVPENGISDAEVALLLHRVASQLEAPRN